MSNYIKQLQALGGLGASLFLGIGILRGSIYSVDTGHKAFKFNKISGVGETTYREGLNFKIPWLERQIIYCVKSTPKNFPTATASKDLQ